MTTDSRMPTPERSCPRCDELRMGYFRRCLACGFDFETPPATDLAVTDVARPTPAIVARPTPAIVARPTSAIVARPTSAIVAAPMSLTGVQRRIAAIPERPAVAIPGAFVPSSSTPVLPGALVVSSPTTVSPAISRSRIARSVAIWVAAAVLGLMALSDMTTRSASRTLPPQAPDASTAPTLVVPKSAGTTSNSAQPPGSPLVITSDDPIVIVRDSAERFSGATGRTTWKHVSFTGDSVTVNWDVSAGPDADCTLRWQIQPGSSDVLDETIEVNGAEVAIDAGRYETPFSEAAFVVLTGCARWDISLQGE